MRFPSAKGANSSAKASVLRRPWVNKPPFYAVRERTEQQDHIK
jgi:hypothetical protein